MERIDWEKELPEVPDVVHTVVIATLGQLDQTMPEKEGGECENPICQAAGQVDMKPEGSGCGQQSAEKGEANMGKGRTEKRSAKWGKKKILVLAASLAAVLGTTLVGAGVLRWNDRAIQEFDSPSSEMQEQMMEEGVAAMPQASVTDAGVTVTAVQTIQDEYRLYILLKVTSGEAVLGTGGFDEMNLAADGVGGTLDTFDNVGAGFVDEVTENGTEAYYMIDAMKQTDPAWNGESITVTLGKLSYYTDLGKGEGGEPHVIDGSWELTLALLDASALTRTWELDTEVMISGVPVMVESVELSPLTLTICYDNEDVEQLAKAVYGEQEEYFLSELFLAELLNMEGTVAERGYDAVSGGITGDGEQNVLRFGLTSVVEPEHIKAVLLGDDKVELKLP